MWAEKWTIMFWRHHIYRVLNNVWMMKTSSQYVSHTLVIFCIMCGITAVFQTPIMGGKVLVVLTHDPFWDGRDFNCVYCKHNLGIDHPGMEVRGAHWCYVNTWWRHQMETFSALLAICAGNSQVPGEFPTQRPVTRSFDVYFDLRPNKRFSKQSWGWWLETLSCLLWRQSNELGQVIAWRRQATSNYLSQYRHSSMSLCHNKFDDHNYICLSSDPNIWILEFKYFVRITTWDIPSLTEEYTPNR